MEYCIKATFKIVLGISSKHGEIYIDPIYYVQRTVSCRDWWYKSAECIKTDESWMIEL